MTFCCVELLEMMEMMMMTADLSINVTRPLFC